MGKIAQPLGGLVAIVRNYGINCFLLNRCQSIAASHIELFFGYLVLATMGAVQSWSYGTIGPSLNFILEQGFFVPHQRPCLRIVHKLLELHGRQRAFFAQNICRNVKNICHGFAFLLLCCVFLQSMVIGQIA